VGFPSACFRSRKSKVQDNKTRRFEVRKVKLVSMFILLALLLSAGLDVGMAQEPPPADSVNVGHILVRPDDVAAFGDVEVAVIEGSIRDRKAIDCRPLTGWEEGRSIDLIITVPESGEFAALINSASYKFSSPHVAQMALDALPDPIKDYSWESVVEDAMSVCDEDLMESLERRSWRMWHGIDDEGVPAYVLWIQAGSYIVEVHVNVLQEAFGQKLLNHIAGRLTGRKVRDVSSAETFRGQSFLPPIASPSPRWWYSGARADHFEFPCCWHVLGVWQFPHGNSPHFHGTGGDATTCSSSHGCISSWTWWLTTPQSKLGIPKGWWATNFNNGSGSPSNYSATVWVY